MTAHPPRHIVFDVGRVLLHWDPEIPFRRIIPDGHARARFFAEVCTPEWNLEQDRGRSWSDAKSALIAHFPDDADNIRAFRQCWPEMVPHVLDDVAAIFRSLIAAGHDVTLLTNFASDTFEVALARHPVLGEGRGVTVSAAHGLVKPDRAIYELHARRFGLSPEATLFIDDADANVTGAIEAGWRAVRFTDADTLTRDLARFGLRI